MIDKLAPTKHVPVTRILVLAVLAVALVSHHPYADDSVVGLVFEVAGYGMLVMAAMGRVWASAYISGSKNTALVTDGPYSIVRNPLYFFSFIGFIGAGLAFESIVMALTLIAIFFIAHWPTILREERLLHELFGRQFEAYCAATPRFIPRTFRVRSSQEVRLDPSSFSKAVRSCSMLSMVFILIHVIKWAHIHSAIPTLLHLP